MSLLYFISLKFLFQTFLFNFGRGKIFEELNILFYGFSTTNFGFSNDETEVVRDADLAVAASEFLFQSWSGAYLCDELADEMLDIVEQVRRIT